MLETEYARLRAIKPLDEGHSLFLTDRLAAMRGLMRDAEDGEFSLFFLDRSRGQDHSAELMLAVAFRRGAKSGNRAAAEAFRTLASRALNRDLWRWN